MNMRYKLLCKMSKLNCISCSPWNCFGSGKAVNASKIQEHHRTQLSSGLDQAFRSINLSSNNYTRQIDEPNHDYATTTKRKNEKSFQDSSFQTANLEAYGGTKNISWHCITNELWILHLSRCNIQLRIITVIMYLLCIYELMNISKMLYVISNTILYLFFP